MSAQSYLFNPTERTLAATGDGMAPPRLTTTGRAAITLTQNDKGMMVYDTTIGALFVWDGSAWDILSGVGTSLDTEVLFNNNGTPDGNPTMSFDDPTDTLTVKNLIVTGTTTALGGADATAIRAAANDLAGVWFDGVTADSRITSNLTNQNIGTGDFSIWVRFRVPSTVNATNRGILALSTSATATIQANSAHVFLAAANGELCFRLYGAATADLRQATINNFLANFTGQVVDAVITRTGTTLKMYVNGTDTAYVESTAGTPPAWSGSVTSSICNVGMAVGVALFNSRVYRAAVFNRTLSLADVVEVGSTGINPADQWGTVPAIISGPTGNGDFENWITSGTAGSVNGTLPGWAATNAAASGSSVSRNSSSPISGVYDCLITNGGTIQMGVLTNTSVFLPGKRYRTSWTVRRLTGTLNLSFGNASTNTPRKTTTLVTGVDVSDSVEFVSDSANVYFVFSGALSAATMQLDNVVAERIGAFIDLDLSVGSGGIATDRSSNRLSGVLFGAGVSWAPTSNAPDLNSAAKAGASDYAAAVFDGSTASTRIAAPCLALGSGDFSVWNRFRVQPVIQASTFPGISALSDVNTTGQRPNAIILTYTSAGSLQIIRYGATTADNRRGTIPGFQQTFSGQVVDVVVVRSGNTIKVYINGVDTAYTEATTGVAPNWNDPIVSNFFFVGAASSAANTIMSGRMYRAAVFNRALNQSDVIELSVAGVNPADQWGNQTQLVGPSTLNGDFTSFTGSNPDNWTFANLTTANLGPGVRLTAGAGYTNNYASLLQGTASGILAGKRYRISVTARQQTAPADLGYSLSGTSTATDTVIQFLTGAYQTFTSELIATVNLLAGPLIRIVSGTASVSQIDVSNVVLERIGAIVDLDLSIGVGYQATDYSTNNLHGTLFNGVSWAMPETSGQLYATTAFAGNSQMLGTLAIPTNAIIEDIIVYTTGISTVFVGVSSGDNSIVGATAIAPGYNRLTVTTPRSSTGNLWVNCTQPDTLRFTIVYSIAKP